MDSLNSLIYKSLMEKGYFEVAEAFMGGPYVNTRPKVKLVDISNDYKSKNNIDSSSSSSSSFYSSSSSSSDSSSDDEEYEITVVAYIKAIKKAKC